MSDANNPYQSPAANASPVKPLISQGLLTETMLMYLKGASPWLRFAGILGFAACGCMIFGGMAIIALIPVTSEAWESIPGLEIYDEIIGATVFSVSSGLTFLVCAVLYFFPSFYIYNFGNKIRGYMHSGADQDLEAAFKNNKSLWKFLGILAIISLAFIPVTIIAGIIVVAAMAIG
jgi:hypothetical protein